MTAEFPWTSISAATGYRGNPRFSTASATARGTSAANAMVAATARAVVLSVVNSVVQIMAIHGSTRQFPRQFLRTSRRSNFHGRPQPSVAIATAIL